MTPDAAQEVRTEVSAACNGLEGTADVVQPYSACKEWKQLPVMTGSPTGVHKQEGLCSLEGS